VKILVINPGSTSTKIAIYENDEEQWRHTIHHTIEELSHFHHPNEQYNFRTELIHKALKDAGIPIKFDAVIGRGGLLRPTSSGIYGVDEKIRHDLINAQMQHVCNLGGLMADEIAHICDCPAFIADPEVVDEFIPEARISGIPEIERKSIFHALNSKATSRQYAASIGHRYEDLNLIVVHLGGGISVGAHRRGKVIDVNNALNGDGPISPERAGTVPADQLVDLCYSGKYKLVEMKKLICGKGGLAAHLGTNDVALIASKAEAGEEPYKTVLDAMLYSVGKEVGSRFVALRGKCDAIILTGGIAHSKYCVDKIKYWIDYLAPVVVRPGEDEVGSLAYNAYRAMCGTLPVLQYDPDKYQADRDSHSGPTA